MLKINLIFLFNNKNKNKLCDNNNIKIPFYIWHNRYNIEITYFRNTSIKMDLYIHHIDNYLHIYVK